MFKKYILFISSLLLFFSCSLANRLPQELGSEASLEVSFTLPGGSIRTSASSRLLLAETSTVEIILYRPFEEDTLTADSVPTAAEVDNLVNSEQVISETLSFSSGSQVSHRIDAIPLGEWNVLIGSFLTDTPQWQDALLDIPGPVSYTLHKGLILEAGANQLALNLAANLDLGNALDVSVNTNGISVLSESNLAESMLFNLYNMDPTQTYGVNLSVDAALDGLVELNFYSPEGGLLPVSFSSGYAELDMTLLGDSLVATVRGTSGLNLLDYQRLQVSITPSLIGPSLEIIISTYEIPPTLTLTLDGLILPDAARIEAYLYKTYAGDPVSAGAVPDQDDLLAIASNNADTIFFANAVNPGNPAGLIFNDANITAGSWNLVIVSQDADASSWSNMDGMPTAQSFAWGEGITLVNGANEYSLTMQPNGDYTQVQGMWFGEGGSINWDGTNTYSLGKIMGLTAGSPAKFYFDPGTLLENVWTDIKFYNELGEALNLTPQLSGTLYTWEYTPQTDGEELYLLITPNSSNYSSMDLQFSIVSDGFNILLTGYTSLSLQLNGLLLSDTAVVDVMIYDSSLAGTLSAITTDSDMSIFRAQTDVYTQTVALADLSPEKVIVLDNIPTAITNPQIQVCAIPGDFWDEINQMITSWFYVTDVLSATSYIRENGTGILDLSGSLNSYSVTLAPNTARYTTYDITTNPDILDAFIWTSGSNEDYSLFLLNGFTDNNIYPISYTLEKSLSMSFSDISFYDQAGNSIPLTREHTLTSIGVKNSWNFEDTAAIDTLLIVMEVDKGNAERFIASTLVTDFSATSSGITFSQGDMGYVVDGTISYIFIEQSMMTSPLSSLDIIMYEGTPVTDTAPTQADIQEILENRIYQRKVLGINGSVDLSASGSIEYQSGTWNTIIGTFMDPDHTSWEGTISDRDGNTITAPVYLSYEVQNGVVYNSGTISGHPTLLMNQERFHYETGGWADVIDPGATGYTYFSYGTDTFNYSQQDFSNVPLTLVAEGFSAGINKVYLGNLDDFIGSFHFSIFSLDGSHLGSSISNTLQYYSDVNGNYYEFNVPDPDIPYVFVLFPKFSTQNMSISVDSSPFFTISHTYTNIPAF